MASWRDVGRFVWAEATRPRFSCLFLVVGFALAPFARPLGSAFVRLLGG